MRKYILFLGVLTMMYGCAESTIEDNELLESNPNQLMDFRINANSLIIDANDVGQKIEGFGVSQAARYEVFTHSKRDSIMDLLFSQEKGLGLDILRGEIFPSYSKQEGEEDFEMDADIEVPLGSSYFTNNNDTEELERRAQLWISTHAYQDYGVKKLVFSTWSSPAWMKSNDSVSHGTIQRKHFDDYARFLAHFVRAYKENGLPIYAVSPTNEPEYAAPWNSCLWTPQKLATFIGEHMGPVFEEQKTKARIIGGECGWWEVARGYNKLLMSNASADNYMDIIAGHGYGLADIIKPMDFAEQENKSIWLTEISHTDKLDVSMEDGLDWAIRFHRYLQDAHVNALLYWTGGITGGDNEGLIHLDGDNFVVAKRFDTFGNYTRFVNPGDYRLNYDQRRPLKDVYTTVFKSGKKIVLVCVNNSDNDLAQDGQVLGGKKLSKANGWITDKDSRWEEMTPQFVDKDNYFNLSIPSKSVVTWVLE